MWAPQLRSPLTCYFLISSQFVQERERDKVMLILAIIAGASPLFRPQYNTCTSTSLRSEASNLVCTQPAMGCSHYNVAWWYQYCTSISWTLQTEPACYIFISVVGPHYEDNYRCNTEDNKVNHSQVINNYCCCKYQLIEVHAAPAFLHRKNNSDAFSLHSYDDNL